MKYVGLALFTALSTFASHASGGVAAPTCDAGTTSVFSAMAFSSGAEYAATCAEATEMAVRSAEKQFSLFRQNCSDKKGSLKSSDMRYLSPLTCDPLGQTNLVSRAAYRDVTCCVKNEELAAVIPTPPLNSRDGVSYCVNRGMEPVRGFYTGHGLEGSMYRSLSAESSAGPSCVERSSEAWEEYAQLTREASEECTSRGGTQYNVLNAPPAVSCGAIVKYEGYAHCCKPDLAKLSQMKSAKCETDEIAVQNLVLAASANEANCDLSEARALYSIGLDRDLFANKCRSDFGGTARTAEIWSSTPWCDDSVQKAANVAQNALCCKKMVLAPAGAIPPIVNPVNPMAAPTNPGAPAPSAPAPTPIPPAPMPAGAYGPMPASYNPPPPAVAPTMPPMPGMYPR